MSFTYEHVMLDIETMGKRPSAPIVYIGAVAFNLEERKIGPVFSHDISLESSVRSGAVLEASTVTWWLRQSEDARKLIYEGTSELVFVLQRFSNFCGGLCNRQLLNMWGNGSEFDNVILGESYERLGLVTPWEFWNNRSYRSKKKEVPDLRIVHEGIHHSAVDDAMSQVKHLFAIYDHLGQ